MDGVHLDVFVPQTTNDDEGGHFFRGSTVSFTIISDFQLVTRQDCSRSLRYHSTQFIQAQTTLLSKDRIHSRLALARVFRN